jgi:hypothetical protein
MYNGISHIALNNCIVYFDDLLVHSKAHSDHRIAIEKVFQKLRKFDIKLNP